MHLLVPPLETVVAVWLRRATPPGCGSVLDAHELARQAGLADPRAVTAYGHLHTLARVVVGAVTGQPPGAVRFDRTCQQCGEQHGRPVVVGDPQLHVSLSRAGDRVALAVTRVAPVGVDIEALAGADFEGFAGVALHPAERASTESLVGDRLRRRAHAWVRKEAALKALGTGLAVDPTSFPAPVPGVAATVLAGLPEVVVADLAVGPGQAGAVALAGASQPVVVEVARLGSVGSGMPWSHWSSRPANGIPGAERCTCS